MKKEAARKTFLAQRKQISPEKIEILSYQIAKLFFANFDLQNIKTIHVFLPIKKQNEVNTFQIINQLREDFPQIEILIPKVNPINFSMENYLFHSTINFQENDWGILEPADESTISANNPIDLVFLPLIAFDKSGYRVGYGKGFYDRFLAKYPPQLIKVGLSIFEPIETIEDVNELDLKMDFCITPTEVCRF